MVLVSSEVVSKGEEGVMCKLDMEKVYDHVRWALLITCWGGWVLGGSRGGG